MKPENHPHPKQLLAYATGAADVPLRLLVETHLTFCAACAREVGRLGAPGSTVLEAMPEAPVPTDLFGRIWAEASQHPPPEPVAGLPLPSALLAELPAPADWRWREVQGEEGSRVARVLKHEGSALYVVHVPPGRRFPLHVHRGDEDTLVLAGGVRDGCRFLEAGDWSSQPAGSRHGLVADAEKGGWALVREERGPESPPRWKRLLAFLPSPSGRGPG